MQTSDLLQTVATIVKLLLSIYNFDIIGIRDSFDYYYRMAQSKHKRKCCTNKSYFVKIKLNREVHHSNNKIVIIFLLLM